MAGHGGARVVSANRMQTSLDLVDLDGWLASDHPARAVVAYVATRDLAPFYARIQARAGSAGRPALDPAVLLALWLYATIEGVGSARAIERLSESDLAYRWLRGGMPLNYHSLSDFRVGSAQELDALLSESLADLLAEGLINLEEVLIDGTKVRAGAGLGSFKTEVGLAEAERLARARIAALKAEVEADPAAGLRRRQAARERAAREQIARVAAARATRAKIAAERAARGNRDGDGDGSANRPEAKASLTDPEARVMRFVDGARAPGYNVQVAATVDHGFVVSVLATDRRNDTGLLAASIAEIERRTGVRPARAIADQGYAAVDDIVRLAAAPRPTLVYAPVPPERTDIKPQYLRRRERRRELEPEAVKDWRGRMQTEEGQRKVRSRRRIELTIAHLKTAAFARQLLRGLVKVQTSAILQALAHNLRTAIRLRTA